MTTLRRQETKIKIIPQPTWGGAPISVAKAENGVYQGDRFLEGGCLSPPPDFREDAALTGEKRGNPGMPGQAKLSGSRQMYLHYAGRGQHYALAAAVGTMSTPVNVHENVYSYKYINYLDSLSKYFQITEDTGLTDATYCPNGIRINPSCFANGFDLETEADGRKKLTLHIVADQLINDSATVTAMGGCKYEEAKNAGTIERGHTTLRINAFDGIALADGDKLKFITEKLSHKAGNKDDGQHFASESVYIQAPWREGVGETTFTVTVPRITDWKYNDLLNALVTGSYLAENQLFKADLVSVGPQIGSTGHYYGFYEKFPRLQLVSATGFDGADAGAPEMVLTFKVLESQKPANGGGGDTGPAGMTTMVGLFEMGGTSIYHDSLTT